MENIYEKLREQLDQYSIGFPSTESGVDIALLKKLFKEEEAEVFLYLSLKPDHPKKVALKMNRPEEEVAVILHSMAERGLILSFDGSEGKNFVVVPYMFGIFDFQVKRLDMEMAELMEKYQEEALSQRMSEHELMTRIIPVNKSLDNRTPVAPYENAKEIILASDAISVTDCICRTLKKMTTESCSNPKEVCFSFGVLARHHIEHNIGRQVDQKEALKILDQCEEAGLVHQPSIGKNAGVLCNCCKCCCHILEVLQKIPDPMTLIIANYQAKIKNEECLDCGNCIERCPMKIISRTNEGEINIDIKRCIGCGLCASRCPAEAITIHLKDDAARKIPPDKNFDYFIKLAMNRKTSLVPLVYRNLRSREKK